MDPEAQSSHDAASFNSSDRPPADSSNGDLHQNLPPFDPAESINDNLAGELEQSRSSNQDLVAEVSSLRDAISKKEQTTGLLQTQLHETRGRVQDLSAELSSLEVENREHAEIAACLAQEAQALHAKKVALQDENAKSALEKDSLVVAIAEVEEKVSSVLDDFDRKMVAIEGAYAQILMICFEVEKFRLEKEEYLKEISMLDASNEAMTAQVVHLREQEKALLSEVDDLISAKECAEHEVSVLHRELRMQLDRSFTMNKKSLSDELDEAQAKVRASLSDELDEAQAKVRALEGLDNDLTVQEATLVARIKDAEQQLDALRVNFGTIRQARDQEESKVNSSRTLDIACMKVEACEGDLQTLKSTSEMQVEGADASQRRRIQKLEGQVSILRAEIRGLVHSNIELKAMLRKQQNEVVMSTQLREDVKKFEGFLSEAEEKAQALKEREVELKSKLQELTISVSKKQRLGGLATPLMISSGTIVVVGLLVCLWHAKAKAK